MNTIQGFMYKIYKSLAIESHSLHHGSAPSQTVAPRIEQKFNFMNLRRACHIQVTEEQSILCVYKINTRI